MISRRILSQFTKFVFGDRKIWRIPMVTMTFVYDCVYVTGTRTILPAHCGACPHLYLHSTKCTALPQYCH